MLPNSSVNIWTGDCGMKYFLMGNFVAYACILPIFFAVVLVGFQRWRGRRSGSVSTATSNIDVFAYNMVVLELLGISGVCLYIYALYSSWVALNLFLIYFLVLIGAGPILLLVLTCMDCYLAVLHPVTYLRLRSRAGVRIRNAVVAATWLISLIFGVLRSIYPNTCFYLVFVAVSLIVMSFCCTAVVRALVRPKPGDRGGARERVDQSKKRAVYTMVAIIMALLIRFSLNLLTEVVRGPGWSQHVCLVTMISMTFHLPSSLVLPLLFLQRAKKLPLCK